MRSLAILCLISAAFAARPQAVAAFPQPANLGDAGAPSGLPPVPPGIALDPADVPYASDGALIALANSDRTRHPPGRVGAGTAVPPPTQSAGQVYGVPAAALRLYMPLIQAEIDPYLYDDFGNPAYDGSYDPALWTFGADSAGPGNIFQARQRDGEMVFVNTPAPQPRAAGLGVSVPGPRTLAEIGTFQARLKLGGVRTGGWSETSLMVISGDVAGHGWLVQCGVGGRTREPQATPFCNISTNRSPDWPSEYLVYDPFRIPYDTWHTVRIEADAATAEFRFYLDDELFGSYVPMDAEALRTVDNLQPMVHVWAGDPDTTATHWADDVRITPAY
jgi:hypothetical protein